MTRIFVLYESVIKTVYMFYQYHVFGTQEANSRLKLAA